MIATQAASTSGERDLRYEGWRVVAGCGVSVFIATLPLHTFAVFLAPLTTHFSWSRESASSAYGTLTLVAAVSAPLIGRLLDRVGARSVIVPSLALSGAAVASLSLLTPAVWHFRIVYGVLGLAMMGASPIACSRAVFGWFEVHRGRALGLMLAGAAISGVILPPTASLLIRGVGWRFAWLTLGLATLVIAVPTAARFIHDRRASAAAAIASSQSGVSIREALASRVFWTLAIVVLGGTMAMTGASVHMVALLTDRGVPANLAALAISAQGVASLAGRLLTGWFLDRFAAKRVSAALLSTAALGAFLLAGAHSLGVGIVAAMCIGFGSGGEVDVIPYLLSRHFGMRSMSFLYGLNWTAWGIAAGSGAVLLGRAYDLSGSYVLALTQLGMLSIAAAGLMLTLPPVSRAVAAQPLVLERT